MYQVIGRCPICHDQLHVARLECATCGTSIEGDFSLGPLQRLNQQQIQFVEAFIRARGSLKDVGAELNMSYPTVNSRLNDILLTLGYGDRVKVQETAEQPTGEDAKREILARVREGKLTAAEAEQLLQPRS
ncbi:MAG TPA: DUF2089 domain-containing protein [Chloroflexota bacterium]|nr:DUF2089 domain-containing protein [Chloroflexota bacterium]